MSIKSVVPSNHLILCRPLLRPPSIFSSIRVFSSESVLHIRWPKCWSFSFSISPSNEYSGLISLRIDWLDLRAVQEILKSLLQHHSSKASILQCSAFFKVQLSHPYMTTGKNTALTRRIFVGKVMSLLFNMLSRLWIVLLISISLVSTAYSINSIVNSTAMKIGIQLSAQAFTFTSFTQPRSRIARLVLYWKTILRVLWTSRRSN